MPLPHTEVVLAVVAQIPHGNVASYGQIARMAGIPRAARLVGKILANAPEETPWHRVVNRVGVLSIRHPVVSAAEQARRLVLEGVLVDSKEGYFKVQSPSYFWQA